MIETLVVGTVLIAASVVIQTVGVVVLAGIIPRVVHWFGLHRHDFGRIAAMVVTVLGLFVIHTFEIWLWALAYFAAHLTASFEDALYISTAFFSTQGSQQTIAAHWRLLGALESVNGFILIGWSIAFLIAASTRFGPFRAGEHF